MKEILIGVIIGVVGAVIGFLIIDFMSGPKQTQKDLNLLSQKISKIAGQPLFYGEFYLVDFV